MTGKRIFLDVDCILADFIRGVAEVMAVPLEVLLAHWTPGTYGFGHAVAAAYNSVQLPHGGTLEFTSEQADRLFWGRVEGKAEFWAGLHPFPWAQAVVDKARKEDPNFRFLTSPSDCGHCLVGKHQWITSQGWEPHRMIPTRHKTDLAAPGRVLVDDHDANIEAWVAAGGVGVLWPAPHNSRHEWTSEAWKIVRTDLNIVLHAGAT